MRVGRVEGGRGKSGKEGWGGVRVGRGESGEDGEKRR